MSEQYETDGQSILNLINLNENANPRITELKFVSEEDFNKALEEAKHIQLGVVKMPYKIQKGIAYIQLAPNAKLN